MLSQHDLIWLVALFCKLLAPLVTMALGVFALRNSFEDAHKITMELLTRSLPSGEIERGKLRHEARREFLRLLFWRCLPGAMLIGGGLVLLYLVTLNPK